MLKVIRGGIADSGGSFYLNICNIILIFSSYLRKIIDYITDISLKKITSVIALCFKHRWNFGEFRRDLAILAAQKSQTWKQNVHYFVPTQIKNCPTKFSIHGFRVIDVCELHSNSLKFWANEKTGVREYLAIFP